MTINEIEIKSERHFAQELNAMSKKERSGWQSLRALYDYLQSNYREEIGEIYMLPSVFDQVGGDCDDQVIYMLSFLREHFPANTIYIIFMSFDDQPDLDHVALYVDGVGCIDMQPGLILGECSDYDEIRVYNVADL